MDRRYGIRRDATFPRPFECLWAQHGVWSIEDRKILQQDYFARGPRDHGSSSSSGGGGSDGRSLALNWVEDHWTAFAVRVTQTVRAVHSSAVLFLEPPVYTPPPALAHRVSDSGTDQSNYQWMLDNMVYAPHHYDDLALVVRRYFDWFNVDLLGLSRKRHSSILGAAVFGRQNSRRLFGQQIASMIKESDTNLGIRPVLIGETGVPMDLEMGSPKNAKPLWQRYLFPFASKDHTTNNNSNNSDGGSTKFIQQGTSKLFQQCFENILQGLDRNLVHYTLWNYTPENTVEHGDHWNGENLSLYSKEQQLVEDEEEEKAASAIEVQEQSRSSHRGGGGRRRLHPLDRGARALDVFCRPYPVVTVGTPVSLEFDRHRKVFRVWISTATDVTVHTEQRKEAYHEGRNISKEEHQSRQAKETQLATELYIPEHHFGGSTTTAIRVTDGDWYWDREQQLLYWYYDQLPQSDRIVSLLIASH
ncbi:hypothetical protein BGW42_004259 [Actinomortierella wolfii]|nr:hypothetical protein BGW42_004259 [Actinomortierella wolfii]